MLSATINDDALVLVIDADGPDASVTATQTNEDFGGLGLGLSSVERRLALLYGRAASVSLTVRADGSCATLRLPRRGPA
jgi:LytS/YehU family sensor histidine kinase